MTRREIEALGESLHETDAAAREVADEIITAARASGSEPIVWVTSNNYMPPWRSFAAAEQIWQADENGDLFVEFVEEVERLLDEAGPPHSGSANRSRRARKSGSSTSEITTPRAST